MYQIVCEPLNPENELWESIESIDLITGHGVHSWEFSNLALK